MTRRTFLDMLMGFVVMLFSFRVEKKPDMTITLLDGGCEHEFQPGDTAVLRGMEGEADVAVVVTSRMGGDGSFTVRYA